MLQTAYYFLVFRLVHFFKKVNIMNIAPKIKKCREQNGLTQIELAKLVGISPMTIRRWEWGERNPDILNTSVEYLMGLMNHQNRRKILLLLKINRGISLLPI